MERRAVSLQQLRLQMFSSSFVTAAADSPVSGLLVLQVFPA